MEPNTLKRYGAYYSHTRVPFEEKDIYWHWYTTFDTLEVAQRWIASEQAMDLEDNSECYYIIMEEVTEREIIYSDI